MSDQVESRGGIRDRIVGRVKEVAGSVAGNDGLKQEGQLHQRKADAEAEAAREDAEARLREEEADAKATESELTVRRLRIDAEEAAAAEEDRIERDRRAEEIRIQSVTEGQRAVIERQRSMTDQAAGHIEADALRERRAAEEQATRLQNEAKQLRRSADALGAAMDDPTTKDSK